MSFSQIDPILEAWAKRHDLHIYRFFKDEEVRSIDVTRADGRRFQLWLDCPSDDGETTIHGWDYRKRKKDLRASLDDLERKLEQAYSEMMAWS